MKTSPVTQKVTYAFAKSDPAFIELSEHDDPAVQALIGARLGHKSTIEESRLERLMKVSRCWWPEKGPAALLPIPLNFSAAHTHRLGGAWKLNMQNLPRNTPKRQSPLRRALTAPDGYQVVAGDASQIEARIVAWICGQAELLDQFAQGIDVYSAFASTVFEKPVTKADVPERFVGKTGILGLGFGVGWEKFQRTVKLDSKKYTGEAILLTDEQAVGVVNTYRVAKYPEIPAAWKKLNNEGIPALASGDYFTFGPTVFEKGAILLPNRLRLKYHDLQYVGSGHWAYTYAGKPKNIYGGALLENIVQALARIITMDAGVRIQRRLAELGIWLNLQAHDELVYVVPEEYVPAVKLILLDEMSKRPTWAPDLPLKAEVNSGTTYADAK
jgi:DNA polymerase